MCKCGHNIIDHGEQAVRTKSGRVLLGRHTECMSGELTRVTDGNYDYDEYALRRCPCRKFTPIALQL